MTRSTPVSHRPALAEEVLHRQQAVPEVAEHPLRPGRLDLVRADHHHRERFRRGGSLPGQVTVGRDFQEGAGLLHAGFDLPQQVAGLLDIQAHHLDQLQEILLGQGALVDLTLDAGQRIGQGDQGGQRFVAAGGDLLVVMETHGVAQGPRQLPSAPAADDPPWGGSCRAASARFRPCRQGPVRGRP